MKKSYTFAADFVKCVVSVAPDKVRNTKIINFKLYDYVRN